MSVRHLHLALTAIVVACAPTQGTSRGSRSSSLLTAEELAAFNVEGRTAYEVVSRLRPSWLRLRGVQGLPRASDAPAIDSTDYALVVIDGHPLGRVGLLRDIEAYQVVDMRYYDPAEAVGRFGPRGQTGVIAVTLKSR